jgi:hypothetical protein
VVRLLTLSDPYPCIPVEGFEEAKKNCYQSLVFTLSEGEGGERKYIHIHTL